MPKYLKEPGSPREAGALPILILLAALGLIVFIIFSSIIPFTNNLLRLLYPKPSSFAKQEQSPSVPDEILLKFKPGVNDKAKENVRSTHGLQKLDEITQIGLEKLKVAPEARDRVIEALNKNPNVEIASANYLGEFEGHTSDTTSNDPSFPNQWNLPKINAPGAWDITKGSQSGVIALVDTGVEANHEDLQGKLITGYNTYYNNTDTHDTSSSGHGTAVAGMAGAATGNSKGIASLGWNIKIMPIVTRPDGRIDYYGFDDALIYAADHGAKVVNVSGAFDSDPSNVLKVGVDYAYERGVLTVAASGNKNNKLAFPAALSNVLSVGATDENDVRWVESDIIGSNFGPQLKVVAPGKNIYSLRVDTTTAGSDYANWTGTSVSAPQVSALAALLFSANPLLTNKQVVDIITSTADDLGTPGWDQYYGCGRINALRALQMANNPPAVPGCSAPAPTPAPTPTPTPIPLPDLNVRLISFSPTAPVAGNQVSITGGIRNTGTVFSNASTTRLRIDVGNNGTWDINPANQSTGILQPNATENETWTSVWTATTGTHKVEVCADNGNTVVESKEGNNCKSISFSIP